MDYIVVLETAYNVNDSVNLADIRQEFVSQTLALGRALYKTRNIDKFQRCGSEFFGVIHFRQLVKTFIGNGNDTDIRLDSAERIVRGLRARVCKRVEKGTFADIRQPYHTKFHLFYLSKNKNILKHLLL